MELRLGQHMGVVTKPLENSAPSSRRYRFSLGINCSEPNSVSWSSAIIKIMLGRGGASSENLCKVVENHKKKSHYTL